MTFDAYGNLWLSTDGNELGSHDGLFGVATTGPRRGEVRQFLTVPTGAETCGPIVQERRVLGSVQHPVEVDGATVEEPASQWPDGPDEYVRPSVVSVWRATAATSGSRECPRSSAARLPGGRHYFARADPLRPSPRHPEAPRRTLSRGPDPPVIDWAGPDPY